MTKLKVLFLQATPNFGGDVVVHELLIRFADQDRIEPHVACLPDIDGQESRFLDHVRAMPGVRLRPTQFAPNVYLRSGAALSTAALRALGPAAQSVLGLVAYVRRNGIDVVHSLDRVRDAVAGVMISRLGGARLVMHMHAKMGEWVSPLAKAAMKNADALIGVSDFVVQSAASLGLSPRKMHCVHNGIDLSRWDLSLDGGAVREEFCIPRELPVFVYSGRFNTWKGPAELVRAAARLKQMGHDFRVLMVGDEDASAPAANRVSIQSLRELASELRVLDNLVFTGFRPDLPRIFAAADAYAMPTFEEPFANVFLEALAMRRPVLGLDSGGVPEAVEHGRSGLLSPPNDIEQFAANMARLIREPQLRLDMGYYGRTRVEQQFQASRMTRDTERIYRQVVGQLAA